MRKLLKGRTCQALVKANATCGRWAHFQIQGSSEVSENGAWVCDEHFDISESRRLGKDHIPCVWIDLTVEPAALRQNVWHASVLSFVKTTEDLGTALPIDRGTFVVDVLHPMSDELFIQIPDQEGKLHRFRGAPRHFEAWFHWMKSQLNASEN